MSNSLKLSSHSIRLEPHLSNYEVISISIYIDIDLKLLCNTAKIMALGQTVESSAWLHLH